MNEPAVLSDSLKGCEDIVGVAGYSIRSIRPEKRSDELVGQLVGVWEGSVRATHAFLTENDVVAIRTYVPDALRQVEVLLVAMDDGDVLVAFMGVEEGRLEMLFVAAEVRGSGLGGKLLEMGIQDLGVRELTVNEQNPQAHGFYEHYGFETYKRTEKDEQGRPFPLLYMRLADGAIV